MQLLIFFAMPMLLGNIFQQIYNMADSIIVGRFVGSGALAAIGATSSVSFLFLRFAMESGTEEALSQLSILAPGMKRRLRKRLRMWPI